MKFNYEKAKQDGVSDQEIAEFLSKQMKFDLESARKDGVSDQEVAQFLSQRDASSTNSGETLRGRPEMAGGLANALVRETLGGFGTIAGGIAGVGRGFLPGRSVLEEGAKTAEEWGENMRNVVPKFFSKTDEATEKILHPIMEGVQHQTGQALEIANKYGIPGPGMIPHHLRRSQLSELDRMKEDAAAYTVGRLVPDVVGSAQMGAGLGQGVRAARRGIEGRKARRDAADAEYEAEMAKARAEAQATLTDSLLSEIDKEALATDRNPLKPDIPKNTPRGPTPDRTPEYWPADRRVEFERVTEDFPDPGVQRDPRSQRLQPGPPRPTEVETSLTGRQMLEQPLPRQRELSLDGDWTTEPPLPRRTPEQLELPLLDETSLARKAREENMAWEARNQERTRTTVDEAFRMREAEQAQRAADDAIRHDISQKVEEGILQTEPSIGGPRVTPLSGERVVGNTRRLPPRGQRGAVMPGEISAGISELTQRVTDGFSALLTKAGEARRTITGSEKAARKGIAASGKTDRQMIDLAAGEVVTYPQFLKQHGGIRPGEDLPSVFDAKGVRGKITAGVSNLVKTVGDVGSLDKWSSNPHVRFLADRVRGIEAKWTTTNDILKEGTRFAGLSKKIIDPDSVSARVKHMSAKEKRQVGEIINEHNLNPRAIDKQDLLSRGYGQKAIDAAEKIQKNLKRVLDAVNEVLIKAGKDPIQELPGYFMKYFGEGRVATRIINTITGDHLWFHRTKARKDGKSLAEERLQELQRQGFDVNDLKVTHEFLPNNTFESRMNISTGVLEDIIKALDSKDPRRKALESIDTAQLKMGARASGHGMKRKNRPGGEVEGRHLLKAYEQYIDQMTRYAKNVELQTLWDQELRPNLPQTGSNLTEFASHFIQANRGSTYRGGSFIGGLENWINDLGLYRVGGIRPIQKLASRAFLNAVLMMWNPTFGWASFAQSTWSAPSGIALYAARHGMKGSSYYATATGLLDMINPSKNQLEMIHWMASRGSIDPAAIREMASISKSLDILTLAEIPKMGERFGRVHSALSAYNFLYDNGMRGKKLWAESERISRDYIMGDYSEVGRPAVIRDHGFVGEAARPLSTFYNWYVNHIGVMVHEALTKGNVKPAAQLFLQSTLFAGLAGAPLLGMMSQIWELLKSLDWFQQGTGLNENSASLREWLAQSVPDMALFGPLDDMLGTRFSGSMAAPELHIPGSGIIEKGAGAMFPGYKYVYDALEASYLLLRDSYTDNKLTDAEKVKAWKNFAPGKIVDGMIDNWPIITGQRSTTMMGKQGAGGYERATFPPLEEGSFLDQAKEVATRYTDPRILPSVIGGGTTKEARKKLHNFAEKEREQMTGERKARTITLLSNMEKSGNIDKEAYNRLWDKLSDMGMTNKQIAKAIDARTKGLESTYEERAVGRGKTPRQARRTEDILKMEEAGGYGR